MKKLFCFLFALLLAAAPALGAFAEGEAAAEKPKVAAENTTQADDPGTDAPSLDYDSDSGDE